VTYGTGHSHDDSKKPMLQKFIGIDAHVRVLISEEMPCQNYAQYLGLIDALGILNFFGNSPECRPFADDSTNTLFRLVCGLPRTLANEHADAINENDTAGREKL
jgi:hypothetical protein